MQRKGDAGPLMAETLGKRNGDELYFDDYWRRFNGDPHGRNLAPLWEETVTSRPWSVGEAMQNGIGGVAVGTAWRIERVTEDGPYSVKIGSMTLTSTRAIRCVAQEDDLLPRWMVWAFGEHEVAQLVLTFHDGKEWHRVDLADEGKLLAVYNNQVFFVRHEETGTSVIESIHAWLGTGQTIHMTVPDYTSAWIGDDWIIAEGEEMLYIRTPHVTEDIAFTGHVQSVTRKQHDCEPEVILIVLETDDDADAVTRRHDSLYILGVPKGVKIVDWEMMGDTIVYARRSSTARAAIVSLNGHMIDVFENVDTMPLEMLQYQGHLIVRLGTAALDRTTEIRVYDAHYQRKVLDPQYPFAPSSTLATWPFMRDTGNYLMRVLLGSSDAIAVAEFPACRSCFASATP